MPSKKKDALAPIWERLASQIHSSRNIDYENAKSFAKNILVKRGHLNGDGTPTFEGIQRGLMTPEQRAKLEELGGESGLGQLLRGLLGGGRGGSDRGRGGSDRDRGGSDRGRGPGGR